MKKIYLLFLILLLPSVVYARNINVCNYKVKYGNKTRRVEIYYFSHEGKWDVVYQSCNDWSDAKNCRVAKLNNFSYVFSDEKFPVIWTDGETKNTLKNFGCPTYVFLDYTAFDELCFSEDLNSSFCSSKVGAWDMDQYGKAQYVLESSLEELKNKIVTKLVSDFDFALNTSGIFVNGYTEETFNGVLNKSLINMPKTIKDVSIEYYGVSDYKDIPTELSGKMNDYSEKILSDFNSEVKQMLEKTKKDIEENNKKTEEFFSNVPDISNLLIDTTIVDNMIANYNENDIINLESIKKALSDAQLSILIPDLSVDGCKSFLGDPNDPNTPAWYLTIVFNIIKYIAIILLIVLSSIDFLEAVASQDNDALKKAGSKALKRFIICVVIWMLPILIEALLSYIDKIPSDTCIQK